MKKITIGAATIGVNHPTFINVLARYYFAAKSYYVDLMIRITDCQLFDQSFCQRC
jgi:spore coat polysaccharide biosynthesis protein SpsF (cytidylyltransferase family)